MTDSLIIDERAPAVMWDENGVRHVCTPDWYRARGYIVRDLGRGHSLVELNKPR